MKPSRRRVVQALALSPAIASVSGLGRLVSAAAPAGIPVPPEGLDLVGTDLLGLSLDWVSTGPIDEVIAVVNLVDADGRTESIEVTADHGHGPDSPDGRRHSSALLAPGVAHIEIDRRATVTDLQANTILTEPGPEPGTAVPFHDPSWSLASPTPGLDIVLRENWSSRRRKPAEDCVLRSSLSGYGCRADVGLRHAIVHHTVNSNGYSQSSVPSMLRGIQRYHMDTRGWDDIAYNFVIDRFGHVWQAREAELYEPIAGGHTTGLNTESVGVALLGTFTSTDPGDAVIRNLSRLLGWKLSLHGIDPRGRSDVISSGGDYARRGDVVNLRNISGHRDNQQTSCPGDGMYDRLGEVRAAAAELVPVFGYVLPHYSLDSVRVEGWAIERFRPTEGVKMVIDVDGAVTTTTATRSVSGLGNRYPDAGSDHGLDVTIPIDLDTRNVRVLAEAADGRRATLMNLRMYATFIDVEPHLYYAPAIYWMRANDLTRGTLPGLYEPKDEITRAQMATFLWRFMGEPPPTRSAGFTDVEPGSFYETAVDWMAESGVTQGATATTFSPGAKVTRAQMAAFLWRLAGEPAPTSHAPFRDVPRGAYYARAVDWMYATGITTGESATSYVPGRVLNRGEMAAFLFRLAHNPDAWTAADPPPVVDF